MDIGFSGEAHETEANILFGMRKLTVEVTVFGSALDKGAPDYDFTATIVDVHDFGAVTLTLAPWDEEGNGPKREYIHLDTCDDIKRLEVC